MFEKTSVLIKHLNNDIGQGLCKPIQCVAYLIFNQVNFHATNEMENVHSLFRVKHEMKIDRSNCGHK